MAELQMTITTEEREYLTGILNELLKEKLVEEHRTRKPSYRAVVVNEEKMIQGLLTKLGQG